MHYLNLWIISIFKKNKNYLGLYKFINLKKLTDIDINNLVKKNQDAKLELEDGISFNLTSKSYKYDNRVDNGINNMFMNLKKIDIYNFLKLTINY